MRFAAFTLVMLGCVGGAQAQLFRVTDLGSSRMPNGIGQDGTVVGADMTTGHPQAFVWVNGAITSPGHLPTDNESTAMAVNASGEVVGASILDMGILSGPFIQGFAWTNGQGMARLQPHGVDQAAAGSSVNDSGVIVGYTALETGRFSDGTTHATSWSNPQAVAALLPEFAGESTSTATDMSNNGLIVGSGTYGGVQKGVLWDSQGIHEIPSLNGVAALPNAVIDDGSVVGSATGRAFYYSQWGGPVDLGTLAGATSSSAGDINTSHQIVGASGSFNGLSHATLWNSIGAPQDLNSLLDSSGAGWLLESAVGINDAGQIVGYGRIGGGFVDHGVLLTPVPEPTTVATLIGSLALLLRKRGKSAPM